jgi:Fe-S-cluster containining protein
MNPLLKLYDARDAMAEPLSKAAGVDCSVGCSYCCNQVVPVGRHEVKPLAEYLLTGSPMVFISDYIIPGLKKRTDTFLEVGADGYFDKGLPCTFLTDNKCEVYPMRPFACRVYNSTDREACKPPGGKSVASVILHHDAMFKRLSYVHAVMDKACKANRAPSSVDAMEAQREYFMPAALLWALNYWTEIPGAFEIKPKTDKKQTGAFSAGRRRR